MHNVTPPGAKYHWRDFEEGRPVYGETMFHCRDKTHHHTWFRVAVLMKEASLRNRAIDELNRPPPTEPCA